MKRGRYKLKHNLNFFRLFIISMEVPGDVLASYYSNSAIKSENFQEKLLGCICDCKNVLAQQNTILQEVKTELTELRKELRERKAASKSGSILKSKTAKQKLPFSNKHKLILNRNGESQPKKRKLPSDNSMESTEIVCKNIKPEPKPESPSKSHLISFDFFKKLIAPSTSKSTNNPPKDKKPCVPEGVKKPVQLEAHIGETSAEDCLTTKNDVGQIYVCYICSKKYKQLTRGIVKHLIEFHNIQQRPEELVKHFTLK